MRIRGRLALLIGVVAVAATLVPVARASAAGLPPTLSVSSYRVELRTAPFGGVSPSETVTVTNLGPGTATGLKVSAVDNSDFTRTTTCGPTLGAGASCTFTVVLNGNEYPGHPGEPAYSGRRGYVRVSADGGSAPIVEVDGRVDGARMQLGVNPRYVDLGRPAVGQAGPITTVTIDNDQPDTLDRIDAQASDPRFEIVANRCGGPLVSGARCSIDIRYRASRPGNPLQSIGLAGWKGTRLWTSSTIEVRGGAPLTVSEAFSHRMYKVFFNRVPTWKQVRQLADELEDGSRSKRSVVRDFLYSDPWVTFQVTNLLYFDSRVDSRTAPALAKPYVADIMSGRRTLASVEIELVSRAGVIEYRGNGTLGGWVDFIYRWYLGRAPDPAGLAFWTARAERLGAPSVARSFYNDPWSLRKRVTTRYQEALGRPADPAGIAYWSPRLAKRGDQELAMSLALSPEFLRRAHQFPWDEYQQSPD